VKQLKAEWPEGTLTLDTPISYSGFWGYKGCKNSWKLYFDRNFRIMQL